MFTCDLVRPGSGPTAGQPGPNQVRPEPAPMGLVRAEPGSTRLVRVHVSPSACKVACQVSSLRLFLSLCIIATSNRTKHARQDMQIGVRCYVAAYNIIVCSKKSSAVLTGSWEPLSGHSQATKPRPVHKSPCKRGSANCRPTRCTRFAHVNTP